MYIKSSYLEQLGQFQLNLTQNIIEWRRFKFVQMKGKALLKGDIKAK